MTALIVQLAAATIVAWVIFLARGRRRPEQWRRLLVIGALEPGVTYAAVDLALLHTSAANAAVLAGTESLFVVVLAFFFLGARPGAAQLVAVIAGVAGVALVGGAAPRATVGLGDILVLLGALSAAGCATLTAIAVKEDENDPTSVTAFQFLGGSLVAVPCVALQWSHSGDVVRAGATGTQWLAAVGAGVIGIAASFFLYTLALRLQAVPVTTAGMLLNFIPVFGVIFAVLLLGESLSLLELVGGVLIVAAAFLYSARERDLDPST